MPVTAPIVWPDAPQRSTNSLPTTESSPINQHNNIYNRPNSEFNRLTSSRIQADDDLIDRPQRLSNGYAESTTYSYNSGTATVSPASDIEDRHGRLRRRRKRPCVPVAKPQRYRDAGQGRQLQEGKTLWDLNLYYLNLAPTPYLDPEAAIQNDKPIVDDNRPSYDAYGGYDCIPSYLYYGQGGSGGGGHFQHFQNHQHQQHNHNFNHQHGSGSHHTSSSHHQTNYDDVDAESGGSSGSSGSRPPYSDSNRPSGGPLGFFGQSMLLLFISSVVYLIFNYIWN